MSEFRWHILRPVSDHDGAVMLHYFLQLKGCNAMKLHLHNIILSLNKR